jgi:hypothetical protein
MGYVRTTGGSLTIDGNWDRSFSERIQNNYDSSAYPRVAETYLTASNVGLMLYF